MLKVVVPSAIVPLISLLSSLLNSIDCICKVSVVSTEATSKGCTSLENSGKLSISINSSIKLEIYYHVTERQPKPLLVGFINESEKEFFEQLIQVEGIGPVKAANSLIHPINIIANAIETEDYDILEQMPGIGKRAAQKIVATLKGKVLDKISNESVILESSISENTIFKDALEVLVDLGYRVSDARTQINEVINSTENDEDISVENLLREVFKRAR